MMKLAYICSPYRAKTGIERANYYDYAVRLTRIALKNGYAPITPHLYITRALDDDDPGQREVGMNAGNELLKKCDIVIVGVNYGISQGMRCEINTAKELGIPITAAMDEL